MSKTPESFTRVASDSNGNPRYVMSWCGLGFASYEQAVTAMKQVGGKKFNNKQFGGGILFMSYSLIETCKYVNEVAASYKIA